MGYQRKVYSLKWPQGHDLHGLEVSLTGLSIARMLKLSELAGKLTGASPLDERVAAADEMFRELAACLVAWNLEDHNGQPVPASYEGVADQDITLITDLAVTWMEAAAAVDNPLPKPSNGTPPTSPSTGLEASLPMVPMSVSPTN